MHLSQKGLFNVVSMCLGLGILPAWSVAQEQVAQEEEAQEAASADTIRAGNTVRPPASLDDLTEEPGPLRSTLEFLQFDRTLRWLEDQRDDMSHNVSVVGSNFDGWLAGDDEEISRQNESYVRLRFNQRIGRHDAYFSNARIGGRLDLPRASERWKLIFESETAEQNSLRDQRLSNINTSSFTGGFSYQTAERNGWRFNHDIGVSGDLPLDVFYRFRTRYGVSLSDNWTFGLSNRVFYYHHDGWGQDTRLSLLNRINDQWSFRVDSEVNYEHQDRLTEFGQSVAWQQRLGERETMSYELGLLGQNRPESGVDSYYAQMIYRKAIYEDWLVLEVVPQLLFENRYNWEPDPRVQLNFEVYFFEFGQQETD
tara:strand:+ start:41864 stop:42967 length:1104 start_codon:yes stop_codon:yes gene_type:complete